jgi:hypothetical protein
MLLVVFYNKCYSYSNNNSRSTLELKKYLQVVEDSTDFIIDYFGFTAKDNYFHRVIVVKMEMEQHHTNYSFTIEDKMELVKVTNYHIVAGSLLGNYCCITTNDSHLLARLRRRAATCDEARDDHRCSSFIRYGHHVVHLSYCSWWCCLDSVRIIVIGTASQTFVNFTIIFTIYF